MKSDKKNEIYTKTKVQCISQFAQQTVGWELRGGPFSGLRDRAIVSSGIRDFPNLSPGFREKIYRDAGIPYFKLGISGYFLDGKLIFF